MGEGARAAHLREVDNLPQRFVVGDGVAAERVAGVDEVHGPALLFERVGVPSEGGVSDAFRGGVAVYVAVNIIRRQNFYAFFFARVRGAKSPRRSQGEKEKECGARGSAHGRPFHDGRNSGEGGL